ncbi:ribosomal-processing cysteine protease Prp [Bacillus aquiflavi]|uniref:Ribosomal processing cysteine protease Prp n=1 Tax=Bacillus aquiflavi TaxID=2672567 RepID=A0A6B3VTZ6_9BACI|nr:ribosomal-processing cysteine protease Prp [Bacillus aquiflavi]MBA4537191.1 ribosomal-processing cysteine protease Prp [Bacillus aquiflavi]NEY81449.1 ribosomal-processing cysteine protease Prp [Bacillus aquiflavi]UAC47411.1 ribosomal-processing cysteine protease Prp [Bacillus aquiflavi]
MIEITIKRSKLGHIQSFSISGHANFANRGQDIVCAGVSAVSFGTVNAIVKLTEIEPDVEQGQNGFLRCVFPENLPINIQARVQLLLEGMLVSLQTIERDYKKYVQIKIVK